MRRDALSILLEIVLTRSLAALLRVLTLVCGAFLAGGLSTPVLAQVDWTIGSIAIDLGRPGAFDSQSVWGSAVMKLDDGYCMFYFGEANVDGGMAMATSPDLQNWTKVGRISTAGYAPCILRDPDTGGFRMYSSLWTPNQLQIELATSDDCQTWANQGVVLRPEHRFEEARTDHPSVVFDGEEYHAWYWIGPYSGWDGLIGYARSFDGREWEKYPHPVLEPGPGFGAVDEPHVIYHDDTNSFEMWFTKSLPGVLWVSTGYATSLDGVHWVERPDSDFDDPAASVEGGASVLFDESTTTYHMWYEYGFGNVWRIRHATAPWTVPRASFTMSRDTEWEFDGQFGSFVSVGEAPLTVVFDATRSTAPGGEELTFEWDFGDGQIGSGSSVEHTFDEGEHIVRLTATSSVTGESGIVERRFHVEPRQKLPPFLRGDTTGDGDVNITDALFVFNWLFIGGARPRCVAAADTNGDGKPDIADAAYLLNHLFVGGPEPAPPFPMCAETLLESDDVLGCVESCPTE